MGGCTLEAVVAVSDTSLNPARDTLDILAALVDHSLIQQTTAPDGAPRFGMLETLREYACERLRASAWRHALPQRHAGYFLAFAERAAAELHGEQGLARLAQLDREHLNLQAALAWAASTVGSPQLGLRLIGALWPAWLRSGYVSEARQWLARLLDAVPPDQALDARARALHGLGALTAFQGDHKAARACHEQSLALSAALGDQRQRAWALIGLGRVAWFEGHHGRARARYAESLAAFSALDDGWGSAQALDYLGDAAWQHNQHALALSHYRSCLAMYRSSGDMWNTARVLGILASIVTFLGDYSQAEAFFQECMELCRRYGDKRSMVSALLSQGTTLWLQGNYRRASEMLVERLHLCRDLADTLGVADSLYRLGDVVRDQGHLARAAALLAESLRLFREIDDGGRAAWALNSLGEVALSEGDFARAAALCQESLRVLRDLGDAWGTAVVLCTLGRALQRLGDYAGATQQLAESLAIARRLTFDQAAAWALTALGDVACDTADLGRAQQCYAASFPLYQVRGEVPGMIACVEGLAMVLSRQGDTLSAARLWGGGDALRAWIGAPCPLSDRARHERAIAFARAQLGEVSFAAAWAMGRARPIEEVFREACALFDTRGTLHPKSTAVRY